MDNKEEMIEDLDIVETVSEETIKFEPITEPVNEVVNAEVSEETSAEEAQVQEEQQEIVVEPKKSKVPLLVFLIILLILDIAALVIYIIGIDKVLGFIK